MKQKWHTFGALYIIKRLFTHGQYLHYFVGPRIFVKWSRRPVVQSSCITGRCLIQSRCWCRRPLAVVIEMGFRWRSSCATCCPWPVRWRRHLAGLILLNCRTKEWTVVTFLCPVLDKAWTFYIDWIECVFAHQLTKRLLVELEQVVSNCCRDTFNYCFVAKRDLCLHKFHSYYYSASI